MGDFISIILSNEIYLVIVLAIICAIIFLIMKKLIKILIYAAIILTAFLLYVYFTNQTIDTALKPIEKAMDKTEKVIK